MTPGVSDLERMILAICCVHKSEAGTFKMLEGTQAFCLWEDTAGALRDHVVSDEHQTKKEHPMRAEMTVAVNQVT